MLGAKTHLVKEYAKGLKLGREGEKSFEKGGEGGGSERDVMRGGLKREFGVGRGVVVEFGDRFQAKVFIFYFFIFYFLFFIFYFLFFIFYFLFFIFYFLFFIFYFLFFIFYFLFYFFYFLFFIFCFILFYFIIIIIIIFKFFFFFTDLSLLQVVEVVKGAGLRLVCTQVRNKKNKNEDEDEEMKQEEEKEEEEEEGKKKWYKSSFLCFAPRKLLADGDIIDVAAKFHLGSIQLCRFVFFLSPPHFFLSFSFSFTIIIYLLKIIFFSNSSLGYSGIDNMVVVTLKKSDMKEDFTTALALKVADIQKGTIMKIGIFFFFFSHLTSQTLSFSFLTHPSPSLPLKKKKKR